MAQTIMLNVGNIAFEIVYHGQLLYTKVDQWHVTEYSNCAKADSAL